jgi:hypothetical protein
LKEEAVCAKFAHTAEDGKTYNTKFYSLDAIIAVGYRVNSIRATQFRQWATSVLRQYAIRGYMLDRKRMENNSFAVSILAAGLIDVGYECVVFQRDNHL